MDTEDVKNKKDLVIHVISGEEKRKELRMVQSSQIWANETVDKKGSTA